MATKPHNATKFVFTFAGISIKASGEGDFFKITPKTPAFTSKVGLTGRVSRAQSNDERKDVELYLLQTDKDQLDALIAIHEADKLSANGSGIAPLVIKNTLTNETWAAAEAWITSFPEHTVKGEPDNVTVKLEAADLRKVIP